ncbi:hypothetical protein ABUW04_32925 [Streptacidiphilus sp. N1-10]|uniref:Uncharacterized protein n=1 Tax=Streptacidiphilus jeojiensis TaxID=3229225 RepID=A0ABV6XY70_9ACTN
MSTPATPVELPDFTTLFPLLGEHQPEAPWLLTPRTALDLWTALTLIHDQAEDDAELLGDVQLTVHVFTNHGVFERLPRLTWDQGRTWRTNFATASGHLANDLETGNWPVPTCSAEEMALHLALDELGRTLPHDLGPHLRSYDLTEEQARLLPTHQDDYDWDTCADMLLEDTDILMLFNEDNTALADPANSANQSLGIGDLRPTAWFTPFANATRHRAYLSRT